MIIFSVLASGVACEEPPTSVPEQPYVPPAVKGYDGRRLLWEPKPGEKQCYEPCFSPDGTKVVVSYRDGVFGLNADLAVYDLVKRDLDVMIERNRARRPTWSPTGEWIAYQSDAEAVASGYWPSQTDW